MQLHNSADNFRIKIKNWGMIFLVGEVSEAIVNQVHKISEMSQKCSNHSGVRKQWQAKIGHLAIAPSPCRVQKKKTKTKLKLWPNFYIQGADDKLGQFFVKGI